MWCAVSSLSMILLIKTNLETSLYFCIILGERMLSFHSKGCVAFCVRWESGGTSYECIQRPISWCCGVLCPQPKLLLTGFWVYCNLKQCWKVQHIWKLWKSLFPQHRMAKSKILFGRGEFLGGDIHMIAPLSSSTDILTLNTCTQRLFGRMPFLLCCIW